MYKAQITCSSIRNSTLKNFSKAINLDIDRVHLSSDKDLLIFNNWWSSQRVFTYSIPDNIWNVGSFRGTGEDLVAKAFQDSELSGEQYMKVVKYVKSILPTINKLREKEQKEV